MTYYERLLDWLLAERAEQWHRLQQHHTLAHAEDLAWLNSQPRTLERDHVIQIVQASPAHEYDAALIQAQSLKGALDCIRQVCERNLPEQDGERTELELVEELVKRTAAPPDTRAARAAADKLAYMALLACRAPSDDALPPDFDQRFDAAADAYEATLMPPPDGARELVHDLLELSYPIRIKLLRDLGLVHEGDEAGLTDAQLVRVALRNAWEANQIANLVAAVAEQKTKSQ